MKKFQKKKVNWLDKPQKHDYPAAQDYLSLLYSGVKAKNLAKKLKDKSVVTYKAKDIFRASELPHLGEDNYHVQKNLDKIEKGEKLSPILLVRDDKLVIADGYHRLCAVYLHNEDEEIPCQLAAVGEV